ncbi:alpha/beta fold hydrolase [Kitasatospora aburaviensis]
MVPVRGGEVWAEDSGGDGLPLVLIHPGVGDSTIWDPVLAALDGRHRVVRYDARGYGRSPAPAVAYTPAEDLAAVLDHFGLDRVVLVGNSMGGAASVNLTLDAPERVAGLALIVPTITGYDGFDESDLFREVGRLAEAGDMEGIVRLGLGLWGLAGGGTPRPIRSQPRSSGPSCPRGSATSGTRRPIRPPSTGSARSPCLPCWHWASWTGRGSCG